MTEKGKSVLTDAEKQLVDLTLGKPPETEKEKRMAKQIEEIKKKGGIVEIPSDN